MGNSILNLKEIYFMLNSLVKKLKSFSSFTQEKYYSQSYEDLQKHYEKSHPKFKKQMLGETLRPVICDGSIADSYFSTNIYPYLGTSKEMNWGYSGHGPHILALNILFLFTDGDGVFSRKFYQEFTSEFLMKGSQNEDLEISVGEIQKWISKRKKRKAKVLKLVTKGGTLV